MQPPGNYLVWAIFSILMCWPLGIPAIVFSSQVNSKFSSGDYQGAEDSSRKAKLFSLISTIGFGVIVLIYIIVIIITVATASHSHPTGSGY